MYRPSHLLFKYLRYYLSSSNGNGHGTHSPFIFHFISHILNDRRSYSEYEKVEKLRKKLLNDPSIISVEDFGAGSSINKSSERSVSSIAKNAAKPKKFGQLLFRMVRHYQPCSVLELGTSLGITASYLSLAHPGTQVITLEGSNSLAERAIQHFNQLQVTNIQVVQGNFDDTMQSVLNGLNKVDFAFIDGNHRRLPTENYFQQILSKTDNDSILVFDDIHWSREMEDAWRSIQLHPSVTCSVDLFFIGLIFFRKEFLEKQHFIIRF